MAGVQEREEEVVVTKNGRPAAILINVDEHTRLKETVDVLSNPALMSQIAESRAFYGKKRKGLSFEEVFGEPLVVPKKRRKACPLFALTPLHMSRRRSAPSIPASSDPSRRPFE
jgi:prevent-host-death family protein